MNTENVSWSVAANSAAATPPWFTPISVESPLGMTTEQRMTMRQSSSQNGSLEMSQSNAAAAPADELKLDSYDTGGFYDELFNERGRPRAEARALMRRIRSLGRVELLKTQAMVERTLLRMGITFNVYSDGRGAERIFPFDILPRIVAAKEWNTIERGLQQRTKALNMFINDCYHKQEILNDGIVPRYLVDGAASFREPCRGLKPPQGIWCHITGTDLVRDGDGKVYVLEDNLRCPSGVSYVLQNRAVMKRHFPRVFEASHVRPVQDYPSRLLSVLERLSPSDVERPRVVLLTPGVYNSAYYEHSFLAQQMGIELVEGRDLVVKDHTVYMRTTNGFERVDVIYRRIDDDFIDPTVFRKDSMLGVPGIIEAYRQGRVALANAPGTGIADDKVIYAYVEKMIKYYLNEDAILPNVPTYVCQDDEHRKYVLANLDKLVVKAANESGGYGMLVGPHATEEDRKEFAKRVAENPRNYIAQPTLRLSRVPTIVNAEIEGRHVDLRPYILYGEDIFVLPGGLTRVALRKGSLVVNSSQGGGSKDTWVISSEGAESADTVEE